MIKKIVGGIAQQILAEFGKNSVIYSEEVNQNFRQPCFIIKLINSQQSLGIGGRKKFINRFLIQYFPKENNKNQNMADISRRLFDCLEFINAGDRIIRGTSMKAEKGSSVFLNGTNTNYENADGVLNFYTYYNFHEIYYENSSFMKNLKIQKTPNGSF